MDKQDFIGSILDMYPKSFTEKNTPLWIEAYSNMLVDGLDFQRLFDEMLANYIGTTAPSIAFFKPYIDKQLERKKVEQEENQLLKQQREWKKEIQEIEKNDKPVSNVLTPLQVLEKAGIPFEGTPFKNYQTVERPVFQRYVSSIPNHKAQCKFWQQVCQLIMGGKIDELCRDMPKVC